MSPAMVGSGEKGESDTPGSQYQKGVKQLVDNGLHTIPKKYILPPSDRPATNSEDSNVAKQNLQLPIIDFSELLGPRRPQVLQSIANACERYGFFQLVNHGISDDVISSVRDVSCRFFDLPLEERAKHMTTDMRAPVRYGTSFSQTKDTVFCWRDFLKLLCHRLPDFLPHWPASPLDFSDSFLRTRINNFMPTRLMQLVGLNNMIKRSKALRKARDMILLEMK